MNYQTNNQISFKGKKIISKREIREYADYFLTSDEEIKTRLSKIYPELEITDSEDTNNDS
jgi:hypothetical protein